MDRRSFVTGSALGLAGIAASGAIAGVALAESIAKIAHWLGEVARDFDGTAAQVKAEVNALCEAFPLYQ